MKINKEYDLICAGGGIMSATLALMLKLIDPEKKIIIFERLEKVSQESTKAWNNAGTGHSAFCELNYTPQQKDGSVNISKAIEVFQEFERSKQFWTYLVNQDLIKDPRSFVHSVPHHAWVRGKNNVYFLKKRYEAMSSHFMFETMKYADDHDTLRKWFPLIMKDRAADEVMAATRMELGTSVDFGALTERYFKILEDEFDVLVMRNHEVKDIDPDGPDDWSAIVENLETKEKFYYDSEHIFIGAGGGALPLLQKVEIEEKEGYGGFPVSGQWLFCKNRDIVDQHDAKVYSKAGVDAPPMSVPHLDARYIDGKKELLFGPFAGFSTKFLKEGSHLDLPKSIRFDNIPSMWGVFWHNLPLTKYLIDQVRMDHEDRMNDLREFVKDAKAEDWELKIAGQRVQIIKRDKEQGGILEFGTDVVHSKDGKITALLGASPGASTAVHIMLNVLNIAFPEKMKSSGYQEKLDEMIPFWKRDVRDNETEFKKVQAECSEALKLQAKH